VDDNILNLYGLNFNLWIYAAEGLIGGFSASEGGLRSNTGVSDGKVL
jgi:hypothetical protein